MLEFEIVHKPKQEFFFVKFKNEKVVSSVDNDDIACLRYHVLENNQIDFYKTFVPMIYRGKGLAEELVDAGLAWAEQEGLNKKASCWYVAKKIKGSDG